MQKTELWVWRVVAMISIGVACRGGATAKPKPGPIEATSITLRDGANELVLTPSLLRITGDEGAATIDANELSVEHGSDQVTMTSRDVTVDKDKAMLAINAQSLIVANGTSSVLLGATDAGTQLSLHGPADETSYFYARDGRSGVDLVSPASGASARLELAHDWPDVYFSDGADRQNTFDLTRSPHRAASR